MVPFPPISMLGAGATTEATVNIDFNQKNQPARFEISDCNGTHTAVLHPRVGELFNPDHIGVDEFKTSQTKLQGMNKTSGTATSKSGLNVLDTVTEFTNLALVNQEDGEYLFAGCVPPVELCSHKPLVLGRTMTGSNPMLLVLKDEGDNNYKYDIHLENAILGNAFSAEFKKALANA